MYLDDSLYKTHKCYEGDQESEYKILDKDNDGYI